MKFKNRLGALENILTSFSPKIWPKRLSCRGGASDFDGRTSFSGTYVYVYNFKINWDGRSLLLRFWGRVKELKNWVPGTFWLNFLVAIKRPYEGVSINRMVRQIGNQIYFWRTKSIFCRVYSLDLCKYTIFYTWGAAFLFGKIVDICTCISLIFFFSATESILSQTVWYMIRSKYEL